MAGAGDRKAAYGQQKKRKDRKGRQQTFHSKTLKSDVERESMSKSVTGADRGWIRIPGSEKKYFAGSMPFANPHSLLGNEIRTAMDSL
jgi:hypothetical protein